MSLKTKMLTKTAAAFCVLMSAATYVHSAITISFAQSGADVTVTSSGTFNPAVCGMLSDATTTGIASGISPADGSLSIGTSLNAKACDGVLTTMPAQGRSFGQGNLLVANAKSGTNLFFMPGTNYPIFGPEVFTNTTSFAGSLTFNSKSLSQLGLTTGTYVYTFTNSFHPDRQDTVTVEVPQINSAPAATSVSIAGTVQAGSTLTGSYTYTDADSDAQGTSAFRWVKNNANTGVGGGTNVGTTTTYSPVAGDVGSYLYYCVTPVAAAGTTTGTEVCSAATSAVAVAPAPTAIPTLSEWAMIFLASLMGLFAFARIRRQS